MAGFGPILCATDFSTFSERAFVHAAALAKALGERLVVVHVRHGAEAPLDDYPPFLTPVAGIPDVQRRLRQRLEAFASPAAKAGVPVTTEVIEGEPIAVLLGRAAEEAAGLVVVGSHGHGGFERWVLGSVSDSLVRRAPCPVLTVPRPASEHAGGAPGGANAEPLVGGTILCGVDFSPASENAFSLAGRLAAATGSDLVAVQVVAEFCERDVPSLGHWEVPELRALLEAESATRLAEFVSRLSVPGVVATEKVVAGRPWRRLLDLCRELPASLLVLGAHGHGPVDAFFFGSTSQHALRHAPCAVLTVR